MPSSGRTPAHFRDGQDSVELRNLLEDQYDLLLHPHGVQSHADERLVLVAVAGDQALGRQIRCDRRQQLRLRPRLEAVPVGAAGFDDVLDDDAFLIHLDRKDPAEHVAVAVLVDRAGKGVVQVRDRGLEDLREANHDRGRDSPLSDLVDDLLERDAAGGLARRPNDEVPFIRDGEEALAPVGNAVERRGFGETLRFGARARRGRRRARAAERSCSCHGKILTTKPRKAPLPSVGASRGPGDSPSNA
jgi:hypothetical protein